MDWIEIALGTTIGICGFGGLFLIIFDALRSGWKK